MGKALQRTDFHLDEIELFIEQRGFVLKHEKALICSCLNINEQPNPACEGCGGTGWRYMAPVDIKALVTGVGRETDLVKEGFHHTGVINVTTFAKERLAFRDRLTFENGNAKIVYCEAVKDSATVQALRYPVLEVEALIDLDKEYVYGTDFTIEDYKIKWLATPIPDRFSIRYLTYPRWIVLSFPNIVRGTLTRLKRPTIDYVELPIRALAKLEFRVTDEDFA